MLQLYAFLFSKIRVVSIKAENVTIQKGSFRDCSLLRRFSVDCKVLFFRGSHFLNNTTNKISALKYLTLKFNRCQLHSYSYPNTTIDDYKGYFGCHKNLVFVNIHTKRQLLVYFLWLHDMKNLKLSW